MYFSIRKASNGQYYFLIKSDNNETVATSELYHFKASAKATIEAIKSGIKPNSFVIDLTEK